MWSSAAVEICNRLHGCRDLDLQAYAYNIVAMRPDGQFPACAFLFDASADGVGSPALAFFADAVLEALASADPEGRTCSRLMTGLPMLRSLAERTVAVHAVGNRSGHTKSHDVDTYKFVVWDWLDSLPFRWSTVNAEAGSRIFRLHTGECVTLVSLDPVIRLAIDRLLWSTPGYIGAFEIDAGNPLHRTGFVEQQIYVAAIVDGTVVHDRTFEGDEHWAFDGSKTFKPNGIRWEPYGWLRSNGPPGLPEVAFSERGAQAARDYLRKHDDTVEGRVIKAIARAYWSNSTRKAFSFEMSGTPQDVLSALMPDGKFTDYLFNREHKAGGSKATFFIDEVGVEPDDWRYLAAQFYYGLLVAEPQKLKFSEWQDGYGVRFNVDMQVRGRVGRTAIVSTGWMLKPGALPALSTAIPGDRNANVPGAVDPPILPPGNRGEAEWAKLWGWANSAGIKKGDEAVPTPLYVENYAPEPEGECGSALVRVRDARRGLARWLKESGIGNTDYRGGVVVHSPIASQSRDRAIAWAREVVLTLKLNGIDSEMEAHYT